MSRGRTASPLRLGARRIKAREMFIQGFSNVEVARELLISPDTAARYRKVYEDEVNDTAVTNPGLLRNVVANTIKALDENDRMRAEAWKEYERSTTAGQKQGFMAIILKAQDQRHKLFGLFGVRAEYFQHVALVRAQQEKLVQFLTEHLCNADRLKLEEFIVAEFAAELSSMPEVIEIEAGS